VARRYDVLVVGAGPFGATFARCAADAGKKVLVMDKREVVGGNAHDELREGVLMHKYGAHIFHTNDEAVWAFVNRFTQFEPYQHHVFARRDSQVFSIPISLATLHQVYGWCSPAEARAGLSAFKKMGGDANLEEWGIAQVGPKLFDLLFRDYTEKQWGTACKNLPASILARIPIRFTYDTRYFTDRFQGLPREGYTTMFATMLRGIPVELAIDYLEDRNYWDSRADLVVFSGAIDDFFNYEFSSLEYRTLRFATIKVHDDWQGCAVMNDTSAEKPFTRTIEWRHFYPRTQAPAGFVTIETPDTWFPGVERFYPVPTPRNFATYKEYEAMAAKLPRHKFGGRLGTYRYYDMHQVIAQAMNKAKEWLR
jgi:UDP-galactopyranose mutase